MAKNVKRFFGMKPEVKEIFSDLEAYLNYCRDNMLKYDERDLYKTDQYKKFDRERKHLAK